MTSPTAKVFDNQSTSSFVNVGGTLLAWAVVIFLALSGLGLLGALFVAPFVIFGFTLVAIGVIALATPVVIVLYYLVLIVAALFFKDRLPDTN